MSLTSPTERPVRTGLKKAAALFVAVLLVFGFNFGKPALAEADDFDWNWTYPAPTIEGGLVVTYPDNLPSGQSNDVNIRVKNLDTNEVRTFNFHNNSGTWSGTVTFKVTEHPNWPGWDNYEYQWVQVAGTNYHWEGSVPTPDPDPNPNPDPDPDPDPTPDPDPDPDPTPDPDPDPDPVPDPEPTPDPAPNPSPDPDTPKPLKSADQPVIPAGKTSTEVPVSSSGLPQLVGLTFAGVAVATAAGILAWRRRKAL